MISKKNYYLTAALFFLATGCVPEEPLRGDIPGKFGSSPDGGCPADGIPQTPSSPDQDVDAGYSPDASVPPSSDPGDCTSPQDKIWRQPICGDPNQKYYMCGWQPIDPQDPFYFPQPQKPRDLPYDLHMVISYLGNHPHWEQQGGIRATVEHQPLSDNDSLLETIDVCYKGLSFRFLLQFGLANMAGIPKVWGKLGDNAFEPIPYDYLPQNGTAPFFYEALRVKLGWQWRYGPQSSPSTP